MSGAAYLLWDGAMKHGHAQIVSVASNSMPLLSTLYLIGFGQTTDIGSSRGKTLYQ